MPGDAGYPVVVEYKGLEPRQLRKALQNNHIVVREVYAVELVLQ